MADRVVKGVQWSAIQQFLTQIIQFVVTIVLARILEPKEFGLVAVCMIILTILQVINETGFGAALMQKLDRDETDFFSVFILNILMGIALYLLLFTSAPLLAEIFKLPELTTVVRILGLNLIISSFIVVQRTKLLINVDFKTWAKASVGGAIAAGAVGILMAYKGAGVFALVAQSLFSNFLSVVAIWCMVKWRPTFHFSFNRLKSLFQFAYKLILARLINVVFNEIYSSVVALFFNPTQLAFFNRAKSFEYISSNNIVTIVQRVAVPVMCEKQKSKDDLRKVTLSFIRTTGLIIIPLIVLLHVLANPLIICLLTDKWIESAYILKIICIAGFFYNISAFNMNIYNATGRTDLALKCEVVKKITSILIIASALILKNFDIFVWSYTICAVVECILNILFVKSQINTSIIQQFQGLLAPLTAGIAMGLIVYLLTLVSANPHVQLFIFGLTGLILYIVICYLFNICDCRSLLESLKGKTKD